MTSAMSEEFMKPTATYEDVEQQEGLNIIRQRPGQFVGSYVTDDKYSAMYHLIQELTDNSLDECIAGFSPSIDLTFNKDLNQIDVRDFGRGIPLGLHPKKGISKLELCCGHMYAGAKYHKRDSTSAYKVSRGMNGVGLSTVNALSTEFEIYTVREGIKASMLYRKGELVQGYQEQETEEPNGVFVKFRLDQTIMPFRYKARYIEEQLRTLAYLNAGLVLNFKVYAKGEERTTRICEPGGIQSLKRKIIEAKDYETLIDFPDLTHTDSEEGNAFEISFSVLACPSETHHAYVNGVEIEQASTPIVAFRQAYAKAVKTYIYEHAVLSAKDQKLEVQTDDCRSGIVSIIKSLHVDPAFDGQTKRKLINKDIAKDIQEIGFNKILDTLIENPEQAELILKQVFRHARARIAAEEARAKALGVKKVQPQKIEVSLDIYTPPATTNPKTNVLYLFEGQSASGTLVEAAKEINPETGKLYKEDIGILALKGIPLNPFSVDMSKVLKNTELATLIDVTGLNPSNPDDLSGMKFAKIIVSTDADFGGNHISILITAFFLKHFPKVIEFGLLHRVMTPLFEVRDRKSNELHLIYQDEEPKAKIEELKIASEGRVDVKRNKGLGELGHESSLTLVHNPRLIPLGSSEGDMELMLELFEVLSGDSAEPRKEMIFHEGLLLD